MNNTLPLLFSNGEGIFIRITKHSSRKKTANHSAKGHKGVTKAKLVVFYKLAHVMQLPLVWKKAKLRLSISALISKSPKTIKKKAVAQQRSLNVFADSNIISVHIIPIRHCCEKHKYPLYNI